MSQLLEMWQLRQALDMQASALWLISTAQLCRAIAAWLAPQDSFLFSFSPTSLRLLITSSPPLSLTVLFSSAVPVASPALNRYLGTALLESFPIMSMAIKGLGNKKLSNLRRSNNKTNTTQVI